VSREQRVGHLFCCPRSGASVAAATWKTFLFFSVLVWRVNGRTNIYCIAKAASRWKRWRWFGIDKMFLLVWNESFIHAQSRCSSLHSSTQTCVHTSIFLTSAFKIICARAQICGNTAWGTLVCVITGRGSSSKPHCTGSRKTLNQWNVAKNTAAIDPCFKSENLNQTEANFVVVVVSGRSLQNLQLYVRTNNSHLYFFAVNSRIPVCVFFLCETGTWWRICSCLLTS